MATFTDKNNQEWRVELDAPLVEEVKAKHQVELTNLENDPLIKLRNDPMILVAVIYVLCQEQIEASNLSPNEFAKRLPSPPDPMLEAVAEAIVNFFPSGRHSHVREVLTKFGEMGETADKLATAKMTAILNDPNTKKRLERRADTEFEKAMEEMFPLGSAPGT